MELLLLTVLFNLVYFVYGQGCNTEYDVLPNIERRARNYVAAQNEPLVFDGNLQYQWYDVGNRTIPNNGTYIREGLCGTYFPVWMKGAIPGVNEGIVTRQACIMSFYNICEVQRTIEVRNCSTRMIYKLWPTTRTSAYCFDALPEVPVLDEAPNFKPTSVVVTPKLRFKKDSNERESPMLGFSCNFTEIPSEILLYTVIWFVNDVHLMSKEPVKYSEIEKTTLEEADLTTRNFKLGITIKCGVRASKSATGFLGPMTISPDFWLGIKILTPSIRIMQGSVGVVQIQSTVPFGCWNSYNVHMNECGLAIHMSDALDSYNCSGTSISVIGSQACGTSIRGYSSNDINTGIVHTGVANIIITTKDSNDFNIDKNVFVLSLMTEESGTTNRIMQNNSIGDVMVQVIAETSWVRKTCYSRLDPHMRTFDQRYYENQHVPGEFVLYKHKAFQQEVQMKTYLCYKSPEWMSYDITCACSVSIRAGGELFIINVCKSPSFIRHASCKEKLMDVRKIHEYKYEIHMPLGTMVVVNIENWPSLFSSLDIEIAPSVKDVRKTEGLCGLLNNNIDDDFAMPSGNIAKNEVEFRDSWKIDSSKSFLNVLNHDPDYWSEIFYLCVCPHALQTSTLPPTASGNKTQPLCSASVFLSCTKKIEFHGKQYDDCQVKSKRSSVSHKKELQRILSNRSHKTESCFAEHALRKRTSVTYTVEEARVMCEKLFNQSCVAVRFDGLSNSNASRESALHDCTLDLHATADLHLVDMHCASYTEETERYIRQDRVTRMTYAQEVQAFFASTCINSCNGHGDCINGTCLCYDPFIEEDCSFSKADPPALLDTYSGGLCSRNSDECCGLMPIYGNRFVDGITKQKLDSFEVFSNGTLEIVGTNIMDLQILNAFEADMIVPCDTLLRRTSNYKAANNNVVMATGVRVSLSNDGTNYGATQYFYIYDAKCQGYDNSSKEITFHVLYGKCYINGVCYSQGEHDPTDSCKACRHETDRYSFTGECTSTISKSPLHIETVIIVCVVGVIGTMLIIILIIFFIRMHFKKQMRICGGSNSKSDNHKPTIIRMTKLHFGSEEPPNSPTKLLSTTVTQK